MLFRSSSHELASLVIQAPAEGVVVLRAAQGCRPVLELQRLELQGGPGSRIVLDGLVLHGGPVVVPDSGAAGLERLELRHCTLVPGLALQPDGSPRDPQAVSLSVAAPSLREIVMERSICGAIRAPASAALRAEACLIDATAAGHVALMAEASAGAAPEPGPELSLRGCTVVGRLLIHAVGEITNSVLLAEAGPGWEAPVRSERRQVGCVRFSWIPPGSLLPATYHCQPADRQARLPPWPVFTSLRYGHPAYGRLSAICPEVIRRGGEDDNEMGVFAHLWQPQRERNLQVRLAEYLRLGLNAGILYDS